MRVIDVCMNKLLIICLIKFKITLKCEIRLRVNNTFYKESFKHSMTITVESKLINATFKAYRTDKNVNYTITAMINSLIYFSMASLISQQLAYFDLTDYFSYDPIDYCIDDLRVYS